MWVSVVLCILALLLLIVSISAWEDSYSILKQASWAVGTVTVQGIESDVNYGLRGFAYSTNIPLYGNQNIYHNYADCNQSFCEPCKSAGTTTVSLLIISFFLLLGFTFCTGYRSRAEFDDYLSFTKFIALIVGIIIWFFLISALGSWNDKCFKSLTSSSNKASACMGTAIVAWICVTVVLIVHILTPVTMFTYEKTSELPGGSKVTPASDTDTPVPHIEVEAPAGSSTADQRKTIAVSMPERASGPAVETPAVPRKTVSASWNARK